MNSAHTHPAPQAVPDEDLQAFEAEFSDGPPAMGVALLLAAFMAGMAVGGWLVWVG